MARGWESKGIEAQQDDAARGRAAGPLPTRESLQRQAERRALELSRSRVAGDLARASAPAHRKMLEQAIADLDDRLARFDRRQG